MRSDMEGAYHSPFLYRSPRHSPFFSLHPFHGSIWIQPENARNPTGLCPGLSPERKLWHEVSLSCCRMPSSCRRRCCASAPPTSRPTRRCRPLSSGRLLTWRKPQHGRPPSAFSRCAPGLGQAGEEKGGSCVVLSKYATGWRLSIYKSNFDFSVSYTISGIVCVPPPLGFCESATCPQFICSPLGSVDLPRVLHLYGTRVAG